MAKVIKYTGTVDAWSELPYTGKQAVWHPGQTEERTDAEADILFNTGLFSYPQSDAMRKTFVYSGAPGPQNSVDIQNFIDAAGPNTKIIFNKAIQYVLRGMLIPREGQELENLNAKRCDQIFANTTAVVGLADSSIPVDDIRGFQVGDYVSVGDSISSAVVTFDATNDLVNWAAHGRQNGDPIHFTCQYGVTMPGGLIGSTSVAAANQQYYVVNAASDTFKVSLTVGGAAIDITSAGSGGSITCWAGCAVDSFGCRPYMYSGYACKIASITPGSGNTGTLNLALPLVATRADSGSVSGLSWRAGCKVYTAGAIIGNRRGAGSSPAPGVKITAPVLDGNYSNQAYTSWDHTAEIDLVSDYMEIKNPTIFNFCGEGIVFSGLSPRITNPIIHDGWGNGWHASAVTAALGVDGGAVEGGRIYNCNDAPAAFFVPDDRVLNVTAVNTSTDTLTVPSHGLQANTACVVQSTSSVPGGLTAGTSTHAGVPMGPYFYAIIVDADNLKLSATSGPGSAVDITSAGSGSITIRPISLPTDKPGLTNISRRGRFFGRRNIGHSAGGGCVSNNCWGLRVSGTVYDNNLTAVGAIDSGDNSRITVEKNSISRCGTADDGSNTGTQMGAFNVGGKASIGSPLMIDFIGNTIRDCYATLVSGTDNTMLPGVRMDRNWCWNSPFTFKHVDIEHISGVYDEPGGLNLSDILAWFLQNARGRVNTITARGGGFGVVFQGAGADSLDVDAAGIICLNQYSVGIQYKGSSDIGKTILRGATVKHDSTTNNMSSGWSGIILASAGGYATKVKIVGPINVEFAYSGYAGVVGIRAEKSGADVVSNSEMQNVRVHMASASQKPISFGNAGGFLYKGCQMNHISTYPALDTTGWDATSLPGSDVITVPA